MTKFQKGAASFAALAVLGVLALGVNAQMMGSGGLAADDHTAREEAEGKAIWEKLEAKQTECKDLSDDDFERLGEYFMGLMLGDAHPAMNEMMIRVHGEEGEELIHAVMGKRLSGCDSAAAFPAGSTGWMPMMQMMWGGWSAPQGFNDEGNFMMNYGFGAGPAGFFGGVFMFLLWALVIIGISALGGFIVKWTIRGRGASGGGSALDVLKERYARGEINQQEFEEKKRAILS